MFKDALYIRSKVTGKPLLFLFNILQEVLASIAAQEKIKPVKTREENKQSSLFIDGIFFYVENTKESTDIQINKCAYRIAGIKINMH